MNRWVWIIWPLAVLTGCSRQQTPSESALYQRYASQQDLKVAQLNGFSISDSLRVDVVMLQAEDDQAWQRLAEEYNIRGENGKVSWIGKTDTPSLRTQWDGSPAVRVIASPDKRTIGFYRIENEAQYDALIDYQLEKTAKKQ